MVKPEVAIVLTTLSLPGRANSAGSGTAVPIRLRTGPKYKIFSTEDTTWQEGKTNTDPPADRAAITGKSTASKQWHSTFENDTVSFILQFPSGENRTCIILQDPSRDFIQVYGRIGEQSDRDEMQLFPVGVDENGIWDGPKVTFRLSEVPTLTEVPVSEEEKEKLWGTAKSGTAVACTEVERGVSSEGPTSVQGTDRADRTEHGAKPGVGNKVIPETKRGSDSETESVIKHEEL